MNEPQRTTSLSYVVGLLLPSQVAPWYYVKRKRWTLNPRDAAHLSRDEAIARCHQLRPEYPNHIGLEDIPIGTAVQLYTLQRKRRGDRRSLAGPDDPGGHTLTAREPFEPSGKQLNPAS